MFSFAYTSRKPRHLSYPLLAFLACTTAAAHAANVTDTWNSPGFNANWINAANWSAGIPGSDVTATYDIKIIHPGSMGSTSVLLYDVTNSLPNLNSLSVQDGVWLQMNDNTTLNIQNNEYVGCGTFGVVIQANAFSTINTDLVIGSSTETSSYEFGCNTTPANPTLTTIGTEKLINSNFCQFSGNNSFGNLTIGATIKNSGGYTQYAGYTTTLNSSGAEYIGANGCGTYDQYDGTNSTPNLYIGYSNATSSGIGNYLLGNVTLTNPSLLVSGNEYIGYSTASGNASGLLLQNSGNNTAGGLSLGSGSQYTLNGGNLTVTSSAITNNGTFNQSGGNVFANGADANNASEYISTTSFASFYQTGGNHNVAHDLVVGQNFGIYTLGNTSGATPTLTVLGIERVSNFGEGCFTQNSGTNAPATLYVGYRTTQPYGFDFKLNGGCLTTFGSEYIGNDGFGALWQTNGQNTIATNFYLGYANTTAANGTYYLGDPLNLSTSKPTLLVTGTEYIGYSTAAQNASANFTQFAGTNTTSSLIIGTGFGGSQSYSLNAGNLTISTTPLYVNGALGQSGGSIFAIGTDANGVAEYVGSTQIPNPSAGGISQSGGNNSVAGDLVIAPYSVDLATYYLSGASSVLNVQGNIDLGGTAKQQGGFAIFNLSAGTASIASNLVMWPDSRLYLTGGSLTATALINYGAFSQSGGTASFNNISGNTGIVLTGGHAITHAINIPALVLSNTGTFQLLPSPIASRLLTLTFAGSTNNWTGSLDLTSSKLIIQAGSIATLKNQITYALTHPAGITSSTLLPNQTLVAVDNAIAGLTTFGNVHVDASSILLTAIYSGDTNLDGIVDITDLQTLANHWQQPASDWSQADFNNDGRVDIRDLQSLANNWQAGASSGGGSSGGGSSESFSNALSLISQFNSPTPEPASLTLLALSAAPLLHRRRK